MTKPDITIESIVEGVARVTQTDRALVSQITWAFAKSANITEAQLIALARGEAVVVPVVPTPLMLKEAWSAWKSRHGGSIGPGPGFVEAIRAALKARPQ